MFTTNIWLGPAYLFILITHFCESRDLINIEHAHSWYSLLKWDSIHQRRVIILMKQTLYPQATTAGCLVSDIKIVFLDKYKMSENTKNGMIKNNEEGNRPKHSRKFFQQQHFSKFLSIVAGSNILSLSFKRRRKKWIKCFLKFFFKSHKILFLSFLINQERQKYIFKQLWNCI